MAVPHLFCYNVLNNLKQRHCPFCHFNNLCVRLQYHSYSNFWAQFNRYLNSEITTLRQLKFPHYNKITWFILEDDNGIKTVDNLNKLARHVLRVTH